MNKTTVKILKKLAIHQSGHDESKIKSTLRTIKKFYMKLDKSDKHRMKREILAEKYNEI